MKQSAPIRCIACAAVLVAATVQAKADDWFGGWVHTYPQRWDLTLDFDGRRRTVDSGTTTDMTFDEDLHFRQDLYVLDPGIATLSWDQTVILEQGLSSGENSGGNSNGLFTDYNIRGSVLHGSAIPFNALGGAARNSGTIDGSLGRRTEFVNETRDLTINYRNRYFPSSISYSERSEDYESVSGLSGSRTDTANLLRTVRLTGRSTKMKLTAEHNWFNDQSATTDNDYTESKATADHNFRWGRGSYLHSNLLYENRAGFRERRAIEVRENAKIRHSSKLESLYDYYFFTRDEDIDTVRNEGSFRLRHNLYNNLISELKLSGMLEDSDLTETKEYDATLDFNYRKKILWDGELTASLGSGYGITDRVSVEGTLQTFDESHTVDASLIVTLAQRFIDTTTIVVTNQLGTITYTVGVDYNVLSVAENRTELEILAAGGISNGDTILVDYSYQTLPSAKFSRIPYNFRLGADFGWISGYQQFTGTKQTLISGPDESAVSDNFQMRSGAELKWDLRPVLAKFNATRRYQKTDTYSATSIDLIQSLTYTISAKAVFNASIGENFTTSSGRKSQTYTTSAKLNWRPMSGLSVEPGLQAWTRQSEGDTQDTSETFIRGEVGVRWRVRQVVMSARYSHEHRSGITRSEEDRLIMKVTRRF